MNDVFFEFKEFDNFLKHSIRRLEEKDYWFEFDILSHHYIELVTDEDIDLKEIDYIYLDEQCRKQARLKVISNDDRLFEVKSLPFGTEVFLKLDDGIHEFAWKVKKDRKVNIRAKLPKNEYDEDKEQEVLDAIFAAREVYDDPSKKWEYRIEILRSFKDTGKIKLSRQPRSDKLYIKFNTSVMRKEKDKLYELSLIPKPGHLGLLKLVQSSRNAQWDDVLEQKIDEYHIIPESGEGVDHQKEFIKKALGTPDYAILEGPPGSGKTTCIIELILQLLNQNKKVLLVASTHVAVDNVLERLVEKDLLDNHNIIPLRIGREGDISDSVQDFRLDRYIHKVRKDILDHLNTVKKKSSAQQTLYSVMSDDEKWEGVITDIALSSANLICGTTIGFMQCPMIKDQNGIDPIFDYMILDEASKTTFVEFLVPAVYCKRWIISGDVKQLSPYVEREMILANLSTIMKDDRMKDVCLNSYLVSNLNRYKYRIPGLILDPNKDDIQKYVEQKKFLDKIAREETRYSDSGIDIFNLPGDLSTVKQKLSLFGCNLLFSDPENMKKYEDIIPPSLLTFDEDNVEQLRKNNSFLERRHRRIELKNWEEEISWRLSRLHELKDVKDRFKNFEKGIESLCPYTDIILEKNENGDISVKDEIHNIRRISLPSIIELLQNGFQTNKDNIFNKALYDGIPESAFYQRHVMLKYQYRMHPEISSFPRRELYNDNALLDPGGIRKKKTWGYHRYSNKVVWVQIKRDRRDSDIETGINSNGSEAKAVMDHLEKFMKWAKDHPKPDKNGIWEVAILTFYRGQEKVFSELLKEKFNTENTRYFRSKEQNIKVQVCTVDRFQGHEADIEFLSFVKNNGIGFLDNPNRLNVALTRARYQLVLFGDRYNFTNPYRSTELLINLANEMKTKRFSDYRRG